jgi:hypothetical protein
MDEATPGRSSLGQGVVSYPLPREAIDAARAFGSADPTEHRYGPVEGLSLIDAIRDKLARRTACAG